MTFVHPWVLLLLILPYCLERGCFNEGLGNCLAL